jgi:hypothetical protein
MRIHRGVLWFLGLFLSALPALAAEPSFPESSDAFEATLRAQLTLGTSIADAKALVEGLGFKCAWFNRDTAPNPSPPAHLVYCHHRSGRPPSKLWQIALVHEDGKLLKVRADFKRTSP